MFSLQINKDKSLARQIKFTKKIRNKNNYFKITVEV